MLCSPNTTISPALVMGQLRTLIENSAVQEKYNDLISFSI